MNPVQEAIAAVARDVTASTVQVNGAGPGGGSGIVWFADRIVTNAHVARQDRLWITTADGRRMEGRVRTRDTNRDLAAIHVDGALPKPAAIADSSRLRTGELVMAVGHPLGIVNAASVGVVQASPDRRWIRADVQLAPGNSGGPLADSRGRVVGVNSMIVNGLAMAVPSNAVRIFLEGRRARIGVTLEPVAVLRRLGLLIIDIEPAAAAARAGLIAGDILIAAADRAFDEPEDLAAAIETGPVLLEWLRSGRMMRALVEPDRAAERAAA